MKKAVILANLGAPSNLDEVQPFLKNLFSDRDIFKFPFGQVGQHIFSSLISKFRAPKSKTYYAAIGGGSPLHENTIAQAEKLQQLFNESEFKVFVAQRYWKPFISDIAKQIEAEGFEQVILAPLYPHYSTTTTLSIVNEWNKQNVNLPEPIIVERFFEVDNYNEACAEKIREKISQCVEKPHILFSAHSIPLKRVLDGDPYRDEIEKNMELIMDKIGPDSYSYSLCYQSRLGPIKWLTPSMEEELQSLAEKQITSVVVFPISFVSEHVETLFELDIQKKQIAIDLGILDYQRANTVGDDDLFISVLKNLILEVSN